MAAKAYLLGDEQLDKMLRTLEPKLQKKAIAKGTRAGAKKVLLKSRSYVPKGDTLTLLKTLSVRAAKRDKGQRLSKGYQGHTVTHAAKKSVTAAARGRGLGGKKGKYAGDPYYSIWQQWGASGRPGTEYLSNALYQSKGEVLSESRKAIATGVNEIAAKQRKGKLV